ncbi:MAG: imelysin family protein [Halopseudomonas sp.]|uniref:imelysin family protein n=1 Tax=Halopseudomonas sp. TaxID=2901191 RepID=UPI0030010215
MTLLPRIGCCALLALAGIGSAHAETPRAAWHAQIGHGYSQLADATDALQKSAADYCATPAPASLQQLQENWLAAFSAWQAVRFVSFGPIEENTRAWKFQFWPDPKNLTASKVNYWLNGKKPISSEAIGKDSVAVQGFPAVEYLLYDEDMRDTEQALPAARSCALLNAISDNLAANASALNSDWSALQERYLSVDNYNNGTLQAAMQALELLADWRLAGPMGERGNGKPNPYVADAWRSGQSLNTVEASLQGLASYFVPGLNLLLAEHDQSALAEQFSQQLNKTLAHFEQLPADIAPLMETEAGRKSLKALLDDVNATRAMLVGPVAEAVGVVRGFNSSDGD